MATVDEAIASFERNIEAGSGKPIAEWVRLARDHGLARHGQVVAWLKADHGLSHAYANHIAKRALEAAAPRSTDDPVAHLFESGRAALRPLYDQLIASAVTLGEDIEIAPKKANVSLRRRRQFALIQPSTKTRIDLGLILQDHPAQGRLEASGGFNAMFTHRVKISSATEIDAELMSWLQAAYDAAG